MVAQWWAVSGLLGRPPATRRVGFRRLAHMFFPAVRGQPVSDGAAWGLLMRLLGSDLACFRGGRQVFSGLSFAVESGEALVVLGPNGVGKSSLLRLLAGLVARTGGTLSLEGGDGELTIGEQAHYLGHQDALKPSLTVEENLSFWSRYLGSGEGTRAPLAREPLAQAPLAQAPPAQAALAAVGLDGIAELPAAYLSAGQRRRLSVARLIAVKRPIWLLDEPTSALDTSAQADLAGFMGQHLAGGGLIVAAAHGPIGLVAAKELRLGGPR
jgi:heme exporter protein A